MASHAQVGLDGAVVREPSTALTADAYPVGPPQPCLHGLPDRLHWLPPDRATARPREFSFINRISGSLFVQESGGGLRVADEDDAVRRELVAKAPYGWSNWMV